MNRYTTNQSAFQNHPSAQLLDAMIKMLSLKNDAELARRAEVGAPVISKIRRNKNPVSSSLLIRFHELSGLSIAQLRTMMGENGPSSRRSNNGQS